MELPTFNRKKVIDIKVTRSFFAIRPVSQMSITSIRGRKLHDSSF